MFLINDVNVDGHVLSINKITDKSPSTDLFLRERGGLTYPTKYGIEKISITVGYDLSDTLQRDDFAVLAMEVDEYPFVFIKSEKVKSMMSNFTERDFSLSDTSVQIFMVEKISASIDNETSDFTVMNLSLIPFNIYSIVDDFNFISYVTNDDGTFSFTYGVDGPAESRVYQDFFQTRKNKVKNKLSSFIIGNEGSVSDVRIMAPFFSVEKPFDETRDIDVFEIFYTNPSKPDQSKGEDGKDNDEAYRSFFSYKSNGDQEDKFRDSVYVYWKGDVFSSDQDSLNAVRSTEVIRNNNIAIQNISGHAYPLIQYLGKREGYFSISFISKSGENTPNGSIITPYSIFNSLLEQYNYNLLYQSRFSAYNIFKIKSILTSVFDVNGYVPGQVYLQNDSSDQTDQYQVSFVESFPFELKDLGKGKIEKQKDSAVLTQRVSDIILAANDYITKEIVRPSILEIPYDELIEIIRSERQNSLLPYMVDKEPVQGEFEFIHGFYLRLLLILGAVKDGGIVADKFSDIIRMIPDLVNPIHLPISDESRANIRTTVSSLAAYVASNKKFLGVLPEEEAMAIEEIGEQIVLGEFQKFHNEAVPDLKIAESFGISEETPYLGISRIGNIPCVPFINTEPLLTKAEIESEYGKISHEIDLYFDDVYGKEKMRIEEAAKLVAQNKLLNDRGEVIDREEASTLGSTMVENLMENPLIGAAVIGATTAFNAAANYVAGSNQPESLIELIGAKDSGKAGAAGLSIVYQQPNHGKDLTKMTVNQLIAQQGVWKRDSIARGHLSSAAAGKYQFMDYTLRAAIKQGAITGNELFNEATQDRLSMWAATTKSSTRAKLARDYNDKRSQWKAGVIDYRTYEIARNKYLDSIACEWCAIPNSKGVGGCDCRKQKQHITVAQITKAMDDLPLFAPRLLGNTDYVNKVGVPFEFQNTPGANTSAPTVSTPTPPVTPAPEANQSPVLDTKEQSFISKYASLIPSSGSSPVGTTSTGSPSTVVNASSSGQVPDGDSSSVEDIRRLGSVTDYTVFDHDINLQIQAKDGTSFFKKGFDLAFPALKMYVVFGGSEDDLNKYSPHKPNYIELSGLLSFKVAMNDEENPVDVAYIELSNPGRVYTDAAMFWENFKTRINYDKIGTSEELRMLVDMMTLTVGNRIHLKAGYGNDVNELETLFNGEITIVDDSDTLSLVAEGYGRELSMNRYGMETKLILSSTFNSGTRESIAWMLLQFEEIQNLGKRGKTISDFFVNTFFSALHGSLPVGLTVGGEDPESRDVFTTMGSDDSFTWLRFGSLFWEADTLKRLPLLKNVYGEEVTMVDEAFQFSLANMLSLNRNVRNFLVMWNHSTWDMLRAIMYRHPNTVAKPMFYENEMTLFYGIKDQCYLASGINENIQKNASSGIDTETYEREKYRRYKAVSQTHIVSTGVNLISNRMKVNSDFYTKVTVKVSQKDQMTIFGNFVEGGESGDYGYWEGATTLQFQYDDNLRPSAVRTPEEELKMTGCDSNLAAVRYSSRFLCDEVKKMYDGEIVIVGNEKFKNGDMVLLNDLQRGLLGFVEVADCVHSFNSRDGYITSFRPKLFAESTAPYFTNLGRKIRASFLMAFGNALERIGVNIDKSHMFRYLSELTEQLGAVSSPEDYPWLPLVTSIKEISKRAEGGEIFASQAAATAIGAAMVTSGMFAVSNFVTSNARGVLAKVRKRTSLGARVWAKNFSATSVDRLRDLANNLSRRGGNGVFGNMFRLLQKGMIRIFTLSLRHPVTALAAAVVSLLAIHAYSQIEIIALSRDPIEISPLTIFGKPYMSGITGAQSEGYLMDTFENMSRSVRDAKKVFFREYELARIAVNNGAYMSPLDPKYVEY